MSETTNSPSQNNENRKTAKPRRWMRRLLIAAGVLTVAVGGVAALKHTARHASAGPGSQIFGGPMMETGMMAPLHEAGWGHYKAGFGHGRHGDRGHHEGRKHGGRHHGHMHHAGWGGRGFFHGPMSEDKAERRALRMARKLARWVDATPEQKSKLEDIARKLVADVYPVRKEMVSMREKGVDTLVGESVDRVKLAEIREQQIENGRKVATRFSEALADAAEVLTPEQRKVLSDRITKMREWRSWWRGDRDEE